MDKEISAHKRKGKASVLSSKDSFRTYHQRLLSRMSRSAEKSRFRRKK